MVSFITHPRHFLHHATLALSFSRISVTFLNHAPLSLSFIAHPCYFPLSRIPLAFLYHAPLSLSFITHPCQFHSPRILFICIGLAYHVVMPTGQILCILLLLFCHIIIFQERSPSCLFVFKRELWYSRIFNKWWACRGQWWRQSIVKRSRRFEENLWKILVVSRNLRSVLVSARLF